MKNRYRTLLIASQTLFLLFVGIHHARSQEKIRVSYSSVDATNAIYYVAQDHGFYKKHGLDVDLVFIQSTPISVASLLAGDINIANASGSGIASAVVGGGNLVIVACYINTLPYELVVSESIKSA